MARLDLSTVLRTLERERLTGTLTISAGDIDLSDGKPVAAFCGEATGRTALEALRQTTFESFTFAARDARPANIVAEEPRGVRASLSMLAGRTIPRLDLVTREQLLRRGAFASKTPTVLDAPPAAENVYKVVPLGALANALIGEYAGQVYGGRLWDPDIVSRFAQVGERPVQAIATNGGRIDPGALAARGDLDDVIPFLRSLVRVIYAEASRSVGEGAAHRGYRAAVSRLWGAQERVLAAAMRIVEEKPAAPARLVTLKGIDGLSFRVADREYVIGRANGCDIQLAHPSVSRRHAHVAPSNGLHVISDIGSTSGTVVNGTKLGGEQPLRDGDTIEIGEVALRYERA